jgi:hypothetical protein
MNLNPQIQMKYMQLVTLILLMNLTCLFGQFSPEKFFGYPIGTAFTRHDRVVDYFQELEDNYPLMVKTESYGKTYEGRELLTVFIGSEENIKNLQGVKNNHSLLDKENIAIVWLSYNVHGNESSGTEAAMQTAYRLLTDKKDYLKNVLVIIDPCLNPDGRDRYVNFYYQYGNAPYDVQGFSAEHNETWPGGRPNHYLFDLNRDWAWMTQIESKQRVAVYNQWLPHVHVDFHEQGINEPYYFPPAAEPYHEVITNWQRDFQKEIGKNHASYFDKEGWLYFSKEIFDLLYPSYGDTYPTYNGAIGMTYEQGGSGRAGLAVITQVGDTLKLSDRVKHHVTTGLSTVEMASKNAPTLIKEFKSFHGSKNYKYKSFVLSGEEQRISSLLELLNNNQIDYYLSTENSSVKGFNYATKKQEQVKLTGKELVISTNQTKGTLVNVLFEPKTFLTDSLTYDISAWTLPYAYGLDCWATTELVKQGEKRGDIQSISLNSLDQLAYAYVVDWNSFQSAKFLAHAMKAEMRVYYNEKTFEIDGKKFNQGSLIFLRAENKTTDFVKHLTNLANQFQVKVHSISSGFVDRGVDFGSYSVKPIEKPKVGILMSEEFSSLSVGEVWHFFEQQLIYDAHIIWKSDMSRALSQINTLVIPEGRHGLADDEEFLRWVKNGGHAIVMGSSASGFCREEFGISEKEIKDTASGIPYGQYERSQISSTIIGAIFNTEIDHTNPLSFGLKRYHTLKLSSTSYQMKDAAVIKLDSHAKPENGFVGYKVLSNQSNALVVGKASYGMGSFTYLVDNPLFRGFWEQGKLVFSNALIFR